MRRRRTRKNVGDWPSSADWDEDEKFRAFFRRRGYATAYHGPISKVHELEVSIADVLGLVRDHTGSFGIQASRTGLARPLETQLIKTLQLLLRVKYPSHGTISDDDRKIGMLAMKGLSNREIANSLTATGSRTTADVVRKSLARIPPGAFLGFVAGSDPDFPEERIPVEYKRTPQRRGRPPRANSEKSRG